MNHACSLVRFDLDDRRYALPLAAVERVVRAVATTPLPEAPETVAGVINLGGRIVPVFDLRRRFHLPAREISPGDCFLLAQTARRLVAVVADSVEPAREYPAASIVAAHSILPDLPCLRGVVKLADGLLLIQDLERFLSIEEETQLAACLGEDGHG